MTTPENGAPPRPGRRPVLLLDFDGTVCTGDGPVRAYAEHLVTAVLDADLERGPALSGSLRAGLEAYLDGAAAAAGTTGTAGGSDAPADGYAAVASLAAPWATRAQLDGAYTASRETLATTGLDVGTPTGLVDLLTELGGRVDRVLVTNAPARGVVETLDRLGLAGVLDDVVTGAGKPAGWDKVLPRFLDGREPAEVLGIGDVWRNDVEPLLAAGCATALIDPYGHRAGAAHAAARRFPELYPAVREWADDPQGFVDAHPPVVHQLSDLTLSPHRSGTS